MGALWSPPSGWPILDEGLLMAGIQGMLFVRADAHVSDAVYARYLAELARGIDERLPGDRVGVLYDSLSGVEMDTERRQQLAAVLAARRAKMAATTAGFALVTGSAVMRAVLRTVFWHAPPPYPWAVSSTLREGLAYLRTQIPGIDVDGLLREYEILKAQVAIPVSGTRPSGEPAEVTSTRKVS